MAVNRQVLFSASSDHDEEYEVTVASYLPPTEDTPDEPGDGGEMDFVQTVNRIVRGRKIEEVSFDEFIGRYAAHRGISLDDADQEVRDRAIVEVADQLVADWEDSREGSLEERGV